MAAWKRFQFKANTKNLKSNQNSYTLKGEMGAENRPQEIVYKAEKLLNISYRKNGRNKCLFELLICST